LIKTHVYKYISFYFLEYYFIFNVYLISS